MIVTEELRARRGGMLMPRHISRAHFMPISQGSHTACLQRERRLQRAKPAGRQPLEPTHEEEEARAHFGREIAEHVEELCDSRAQLSAIS